MGDSSPSHYGKSLKTRKICPKCRSYHGKMLNYDDIPEWYCYNCRNTFPISKRTNQPTFPVRSFAEWLNK